MEQYIHLLIARPDDFVPERAKLASFCQTLVDHGVIPNVSKIAISTPTTKTRTVTNPFTGEAMSFPTYAHLPVSDLGQFDTSAGGLANYCLHIEGNGTPAMPPLPIDFADPYSLAVRCHITAVPHSTSSIYDDDETASQLIQYDRPCPDDTPFGYFTDPTTNATVKVPDAGRARFWIEFELGKWLFPSVKHNNLSILNSKILEWAESTLEIDFAQGCHYF